MSVATRVREAAIADLPDLAPLFDAYRQFYQQAPDLHSATDFLRQRMQARESRIFIAQSAAGMVGFAQLFPAFSSVRARRLWILNDLFVSATARRQGIAQRLLQAAESFARDSGALRLVLETGNQNLPAQQLYENLGWRHVTENRWYEKGLD